MPKYNLLIKRVLSIAAGSIIFYFLGKYIWTNWQEISPRIKNFNYFWAALSVLFAALSFAFNVLIWTNTLQKVLSINLPLYKGFRIWNISQLGKYIPGTVWSILGRIHLCEKENISKLETATSMSFELILVIVAALLLFLLGIPFWPRLPSIKFNWLIIFILPLLACLHPKILEYLINLLMKWNKQGTAKIAIGMDTLIHLMGLALFNFILIGAALFCVIRTIYVVNYITIPILGGIFGFAWVIGMFALFAPTGIGVREGILTYLLSFFMPVYIASLAAILSRILFTAAEIVFFIFSMIVTRGEINENIINRSAV